MDSAGHAMMAGGHRFDNSTALVADVRSIILASRDSAIRSVDSHRVAMYWKIGERIVEEEQGGEVRAQYGTALIDDLASRLQPEFGTAFGARQLRRARQFYSTYPIWTAVRSELNWYQYRTLSAIDNQDKREFYELEAVRNHWTGRELDRLVNAFLYERLLLSSDKQAVMEVARRERLPQTPTEIIKDPMVLEFLGLKPEAEYYERDLETALIDHLQEFLLELGNGFAFIARQRRITLEDDEFFVDLVFYNRLLRCFVLIDLKTRKITHEDLGQIQMYVNYFDRVERVDEENPTVGILLCADKNDALVKFSLPENNTTILASRYQLYLPTEEQLLTELKNQIAAAEKSAGDP